MAGKSSVVIGHSKPSGFEFLPQELKVSVGHSRPSNLESEPQKEESKTVRRWHLSYSKIEDDPVIPVIDRIQNDPYFTTLFDIMTASEITHPFKLCVSMFGSPYISITSYLGSSVTSVVRTMTWQPHLIDVLTHGVITVPSYITGNDIDEGHFIGDVLSCFFFAKLEYDENKSMIFCKNIAMLYRSYDQSRFKEKQCIRSWAKRMMCSGEYATLCHQNDH